MKKITYTSFRRSLAEFMAEVAQGEVLLVTRSPENDPSKEISMVCISLEQYEQLKGGKSGK